MINDLEYKLADYFVKEEPNASANILMSMDPANAAELIKQLSADSVAILMKLMLPDAISDMLSFCDLQTISLLIKSMDAAQVVLVLRHSDKIQRAEILSLLPAKLQARYQLMLSYSQDSVGALIEHRSMVVESHMKIEHVILKIKKKPAYQSHKIYVLNSNRQVIGKVNVFDLFHHQPNTKILSIMDEHVDKISAYTELTTALSSPLWQFSDTLVVVNQKQEYLGVISNNAIKQSMIKTNRSINQRESMPLEIIDSYLSAISGVVNALSPSKRVAFRRNSKA